MVIGTVFACSSPADTGPDGGVRDPDQGTREVAGRRGDSDRSDVGEDELPPKPTHCTEDPDCDDANPCTFEACVDGTCSFENLDGLVCDDGDGCTLDDRCQGGSCQGIQMDCRDENDCTVDECQEGQCKWKASDEAECRLTIEVTSPKRAATLFATGAVDVLGKVISPAGPVESLTLNGNEMAVKGDGSFQTALSPQPGVNILVLVAEDSHKRSERTVRSFLYAEELYQVGTDKAIVHIPGATHIFLRTDVWDDDDTSDLDDIASVAWVVVNNLDVSAFIPPGLIYDKAGCTWTIDVSQVTYELTSLDVKPGQDKLTLSGTFSNLQGWVDAVAPFCPDANGWIYIDEIYFKAVFDVLVANDKLVIQANYVDVDISGVTVDLEGGFASLFDWLINWFTDSFAVQVEEELESYLPTEVVPLLVALLNDFLEHEMEIKFPQLPGSLSSLPFFVKTRPEEVEATMAGTAFVVNVGLGSNKMVNHDAPGTLKRGDCKGTDPGEFVLPRSQKLEAAVSEDFLNQLLFTLWWGGHLSVSLTSDILDPLLEDFDVTGLVVQMDPHLPPIYTSCTGSGKGEFQIGDLNIWASFSVGSDNGEVELFGSARVEAEMIVVPDPDKNQLGLHVGEVEELAIDIVSSQGMLAGNDAFMEELLRQVLVDILIKNYLSEIVDSYPIPAVNLGQFQPYFPPDTVVGFEPLSANHEHGFVLLSGAPK